MLVNTPSIGERPRNYRGGRKPTYRSLYERLVACSEVEEGTGCWLWTKAKDKHGYPRIGFRIATGQVRKFNAHRLMLEMKTGFLFPYDEAGHLCCNPSCINPDHLEIQTPAFNLAERRNYGYPKDPGRMIPILFPIEDPLQLAALDDIPFFDIGIPTSVDEPCPF